MVRFVAEVSVLAMNISPRHILIAIALAASIVVLPMGQFLMPIPWIVIVGVACKLEARRGRGTATLVTYVAVTAVVVVAAILAPVKTTERVLDTRLILPKSDLTLAEMDRGQNFENTEWLPQYISVASTPDNADQEVRFGETNVSLREFVDTIERQSELRHRFRHCGNGSSILFGGDCCFGLGLR